MKKDSEDERETLRRGRAGRSDVRDTAVAKPPVPENEIEVLARDLEASDRRYLVRNRLGLGGMGEVTDTFDVKIGREIAMKTMLRQDPRVMAAMQERFLREARIQAILEHPAIVPVYDIGFSEAGLPYFTMKRVRGETLRNVFADEQDQRTTIRKKSRHRMLSSFVTVCLAVDYAHQRGIVHRDLKPDNVMLGAHGEVYVLDWGLSKVVDPKGQLAAAEGMLDSETRPGDIIGTPGYMPPEQVLGHHDEVDARSDVYALGAILFELLVLTPRHAGKDNMAIFESTMDPSRVPPPPPPDTPPELYALALQATSYLRDQRPRSARALAESVERYLDGDRDEGLRKKLADERVQAAKNELERASAGSSEEQAAARAAAMQHAGKAMAFAPEHVEASKLVLELLAKPPDNTPAAVRREIEVLDNAHLKGAMLDNTIRICTWLVFPPMMLLMGVKSALFGALIVFVLAVCAAASVLLYRRGVASKPARYGLFSGTSAFFALMAGLFGPFLLIPTLASINTLLFSAQSPRRERPTIVALGLLFFLAPILLEVLGVVPPSFEFRAEELVLLPRVVSFPAGVTFTLLTVVSTVLIITPTVFTVRLRDALRSAEKQLVLQKWQLYQLSGARGGAQ